MDETRGDTARRAGLRVDRVAAVGALIALTAAVALPLAVFRANRIVSGVPHGVWSAGAAGYALAASCALPLLFAFGRRSAARSRALLACATAMALTLAWSLGRATVALRTGAPEISRVSIGSGAWLAAAGIAIVWFAALQRERSRTVRAVAGAITLAGLLGAAAFGGLGQLSLVTEYTQQAARFWAAVATHIEIVAISLAIAIVIGVPLGVVAARWERARSTVLGVVGVIQTVPSLALLGLLVVPLAALGLPGIGPLPAVIALTLYALLPIVRNTYVGLAEVDPAIVDAGRGMGMSRGQLLMRVEAPLALPLVIEGVRAAAVLTIGIAAVVAFINVGTLGVLVFEGWGLQADDLILLGAVPMVALAVAVDGGLRMVQRAVVSPGIRREQAA